MSTHAIAPAPGRALFDATLDFARDLLGRPDLQPDQDLFSLGLTSLQLLALQEKLLRDHGVGIELEDLFLHSTVRGVVELLATRAGTAVAQCIVSAGGPGAYPASPAQARMYVMSAMSPGSLGFNMPEAVRIDGPAGLEELADAVRLLHARHESLHTRFAIADGAIRQIVDPTIPLDLRLHTGGAERLDALMPDLVAPFDLEAGPLYRVAVLEASPDEHYVLVDIHHIVADGWSLIRYFGEILAILDGRPLRAGRIQYKDYSAWQASQTQDDAALPRLCDEIARVTECGPLPVLTLPTDRPRPPATTYAGARIVRHLDVGLLDDVAELGGPRNLTVHMVLMAAFTAVLHRWSCQSDLVVGAPNACRPTRDLDDVFGMFVNMTVNRVVLGAQPTFADLLSEVRRACVTGMNHSDVQFDRLVETLNVPRTPSRHPVFDYVFAFQNIDMPSSATARHRLSVADFDYRISRFDMFLSVMRVDDDLRVLLEYSTALFDAGTAEAFMDDFLATVHLALDDPTIALASLPASRTRTHLSAGPIPAPDFAF